MTFIRLINVFILVLTLSSCTNQFAYKPNKWVSVSETKEPNYSSSYIDENRLSCKDGKCQAWVKMVFGQERQVGFNGEKPGEVSGYMNVKRVDSSIEYDCTARTAQMVSYQLYGPDDKMIDSKWIQFTPEVVKPGTVEYDLMKHACAKAK